MKLSQTIESKGVLQVENSSATFLALELTRVVDLGDTVDGSEIWRSPVEVGS